MIKKKVRFHRDSAGSVLHHYLKDYADYVIDKQTTNLSFDEVNAPFNITELFFITGFPILDGDRRLESLPLPG
jgi:hypothetical protein